VKPNRIFLVRHGQSIGNVDKKKYNKIPDYAITLTELGDEQTEEAGRKLKAIIGDEPVHVECSPYYRTRRSWKNAAKAFDPKQIHSYREDIRLREHEFTAQLIEANKEEWEDEADKFGVMYFRFPTGESCADTFTRAVSWRQDFFSRYTHVAPKNLIVMGHGMTNRLILMDLLGLTVEEFELLKNPRNGEFITLKATAIGYEVVGELRKRDKLKRQW
jgi:broad specificity phosphatase PhoE